MGILDWLSKKPGEDVHAADGEDATGAQLGPGVELGEGDEKYLDEGQIAKGGMGVVRRVFNRSLLRSEAMKVLEPQFAADRNELLRFLEEAQITGQLDHPNIPAVHEIGHHDADTHFFTMKLVRGKTLEQLLRASTFSVTDDEQLFEMLQILIKVCDAIAFAHSRSVIHCDLKPANVMIGGFGQVYVMDWGIARLKGVQRKRRTETGADVVRTVGRDLSSDEGRVLGTLGFMAPEQARGEVELLDERTDVFALGALLYRVLTGRAPHVGPTSEETWELAKQCQVMDPQEWLQSQGQEIKLPARLCHIAMKALRADPEQRYPTVAEFQGKLQQFMHGAGRYPTRTYEAGERVIRQGEPGDQAYVIQKGKVRVHREENGVSRTIRHLGPGEVFGETAILTDQARSANVDAVEPLTVVVIARDALERELGHTFWVGHILRAVADRFRDLDAKLQAQLRNVEPAVHSCILRYIAFNGKPKADGTMAVSWKALRRHVKATLKLGDLEAMAMSAGLPGLRIDDANDEASLLPEGAPATKVATGSVPAIRRSMAPTPAPIAPTPVEPASPERSTAERRAEDITQPPGSTPAFQPPAEPASPFSPVSAPSMPANSPSAFEPAPGAPLPESPFAPVRPAAPTSPFESVNPANAASRPKSGPLPALQSSRGGTRPPSGATPSATRGSMGSAPRGPTPAGTPGALPSARPTRPPVTPAATVLETPIVVLPSVDPKDPNRR